MKTCGNSRPIPVGVCSLLTAFGVLCLAVLALLSLTTARAEKRMADTAANQVEARYEADLEARKIYARLQLGEPVTGVEMQGDVYSYAIPISRNQTLEVELQKRDGEFLVLRWQEVAHPEEKEETLPVWQGTS